ncbi:nucleic acid/nucleotide deaminase domain-containing protein [Kutzneria sp. NPDC052558]|uniref:nucleic acid/nucleotide deaminase domain-containing protein n=1 Tax=Kutzneria sp. NPDC052558 TaxID=3364121 RepID=UPI0037C9E078
MSPPAPPGGGGGRPPRGWGGGPPPPPHNAAETVYDLTVADVHAFYVLAGDTSVLVHNACPEGQIRYNSSPLSQVAFRSRMENMTPIYRNVAVARIKGWNDPKTGDYVVGFSRGTKDNISVHSEDDILAQIEARPGFDVSQIEELYTERQPCPTCKTTLENKLTPGTSVTWSVPYDSTTTSESRDLLLEYFVNRANGR